MLPNVVWTSLGPVPVDALAEVRLRARIAGEPLTVLGVDKFPRMVDYVVPTGVRIADADRVRLGAHLAEGTTVMHEGFCNYNAGTLGPSMVEGRISAGVVVGAGSDIGGGASIMGTLSGGGTQQVTIGEGALIGANAGIGISLGDRSRRRGRLLRDRRVEGDPARRARSSRAASSPGVADLLFRRNSRHRRAGGDAANGPLGRPGGAPARQRLSARGPAARACPRHRQAPAAVRCPRIPRRIGQRTGLRGSSRRRLAPMRAAALLVLGLLLGFVGAVIQTHTVTVGSVRLPTGAVLGPGRGAPGRPRGRLVAGLPAGGRSRSRSAGSRPPC